MGDTTEPRRRTVLQAAAGTALATNVAGCLGDDDRTVEIAAGHPFEDADAEILAALRDAGLDDDIEVSITTRSPDLTPVDQHFRGFLESDRSSPELLVTDGSWTLPLIVDELLAPVEDALPGSTIEHVESTSLPAALGTATQPASGVLYGLPLTVDFPTIQYRRDLVEEAGYDPEGENWSTEPMTWQSFAEIVADVWDYHGGEDEYTYGFTTQAQAYEGLSCCTFYETMRSVGGAYFGGQLYGPVGDRPVTVDEPAVVEAVRMMRSFMYGPDTDDAASGYPQITTDDITEFDEEGAREPFTGGDALFMRNWPYTLEFHAEEADFEVGTMPLPYGIEPDDAEYERAGGSCHTCSAQHLVLNPEAESREATLAVLEAFVDERVQRTILEVTGELPPDPDVIGMADPAALGALGDHLETLAVAADRTIPQPGSVGWSDHSVAIREAVHDAYTGERTPAAALSELATKIE